MSEYLGLFLDESRENLQALNESLLLLERDPGDPEPLNVIFRVAHSLKGMSATMGFERMAGLTHAMEEVLASCRDGGPPMTGEIVGALFSCLDRLEAMVDEIAAGGKDAVDADALIGQLEGILRGGPALAGAVAEMAATLAPPMDEVSVDDRVIIDEAAAHGMRVVSVRVTLAESCVLRGARAYMVVHELERLGEIVRMEPTSEEIERDEIGQEIALWLVTDAAPEAVAGVLGGVSEVARCSADAVSADAPAIPDAPAAEPAPPARPEARRARPAATVRVGTDKLDSLMNVMGEMVIQRTRLSRISSDHGLGDLRTAVQEMTRVTNDLQGLVMQVRMMPVEAVFMRFPRMVRDLAQSLGKRVDLLISGEDTELDRTVIDEIGDPLVHLLRNAIDHGLETPGERRAAGKLETGRLWLSARHAGSSVVVEVREDGRGIDPGRIRDAVQARGLRTRPELDALSDQEAVELIFLPGFSTAAEATDVSGRGVGMDVVRAKIAALSGEVRIHSEIGVGSTFSIRLPLTLAIIQALLVRAAGQTYALPLEAIEETVVIGRDDLRPVSGRPCMVLRDNVVPLLRLSEGLGISGDEEPAERLDVVVVRAGGPRLGVVVDRLVGRQDIVIKHLPDYLGDVRGVAGATLLGDGSVALIVDVAALGGAPEGIAR